MGASPLFSELTRGRRAALIVVLGGVCTVGPFSIDLYLPALPTVARDLGATPQAIALTVTTFLIGLAAGQLLAGPLSDTYGRKLVLLAGLSLFAVSSLACSLAPSAGVLIGLRTVQGISSACGVAIANAVVTDYVQGRQAARLLSRLALVSGLAPIVAPLVGAQLLRFTSWRGVFIVLTGIGVALIAGVAAGLRESLPRERRSRGGLGRTTRRFGSLSRDGHYMSYALTSAFSSAAFFAYLAASSFVFQGIYGVSPVTFSLLFATNAVGMLIASQLNHRLLARFTPRQLLAAGLVGATCAGAGVLAVSLGGGIAIAAMAAPLFLLVASAGVSGPDATALALSLHPEVGGSASALFGTLRLVLGALATPLVGLGGSTSSLPMAIVIFVSSLCALVSFAAVSGRAYPTSVVVDSPDEAAADMRVC